MRYTIFLILYYTTIENHITLYATAPPTATAAAPRAIFFVLSLIQAGCLRPITVVLTRLLSLNCLSFYFKYTYGLFTNSTAFEPYPPTRESQPYLLYP